MGLFGLFATMIGLGAMTKDSFSNFCDNIDSREEAKQKGRSTYLVNGHTVRATATGKSCIREKSRINGHEILRDSKTGQFIEDLTESRNIEETEKNRQKALSEGKKFYRTAMFDLFPQTFLIYVCDETPGKYYARSSHHGIEMYVEGDLVKKSYDNIRIYGNWMKGKLYNNKFEECDGCGNPIK